MTKCERCKKEVKELFLIGIEEDIKLGLYLCYECAPLKNKMVTGKVVKNKSPNSSHGGRYF